MIWNARPDLRSRSGSSIVEGMIAAVLVGVAAVGTAGLVDYIQKQSRRAQLLNRAMTVQSALVRAVISKEQYIPPANVPIPPERQQVLALIAAGQKPVGLKILANPLDPVNSPTLAVIGQRVGYNIDDTAAACTANCAVWVDTDVSCGLDKQCRAAYRVTVSKQSDGDIPPVPLGAPPPAGVPPADPKQYVGFADASEYTVPISYDIFQQSPRNDCGSTPDGLAISGMDRTTGQLSCLSRQVQACPAPKIGHGVKAVADGLNTRLALDCHDLANVRCPANYVLQKFNYAQLDPGGVAPTAVALDGTGTMPGLVGSCVYRYLNKIPWQGAPFATQVTAATATYAAKVCNTDIYYALPSSPNCQVQWVSTPPLYCPAPCFNAMGLMTNATACGHNVTATATISAQKAPSAPPTSDNIASCTVTVQQGSCGGGTTNWTASGVWSGTCVVQESWPTRNPTLHYPPVGGTLGP